MIIPKTIRIGVDVDGVLADFCHGFIEALKVVGCSASFPVEDPGFPVTWDWPQHYGATQADVDAAWTLIKEDYTFWVRLASLPNAVDDLRLLHQVFNNGHEIYYITSRPGNRAKFQTETWLALRGVLCPTVLIAEGPTSKGLLARGLQLDALIDDRPDNLLALPSRTMPFLYKTPYNEEWRTACPGLAWAVTSVTDMIEVLDKTGVQEGKAA